MALSLSDLAEDKPTIDKLGLKARFYYEFGRFICAFAMVEMVTHALFRNVSEIDDVKARAIVGGFRLTELIQTIQRIAAINSENEKDNGQKEITMLFDQLNTITAFRHALVHRGATVGEDEIVSTNILTAKTMRSIEELRFGIDDIRKATDDLEVIAIRLGVLMEEQDIQFDPEALTYLHAPWRYKPVRPSNWLTRILAENLRQPIPPQPSEA